jgi:exonuclease III
VEQKSSQSKKEDRGKELGVEIWSTNADVFNLNKVTELKSRLQAAEKLPDIIAVSEVRAKNRQNHIDNNIYNIEGYEKECLNTSGDTGRGMILYVRSNLNYDFKDVNSLSDDQFSEAQVVEVFLNEKQTLGVCSIYRSPNSSSLNNERLNNFLKLMCDKQYTHLVVVGDFNYRHIDWKTQRCLSSETSEDFKFMEVLRDCFMTQHVCEPTRARGEDKPSVLDLVITNEIETVHSIAIESPLGKSDHATVQVV